MRQASKGTKRVNPIDVECDKCGAAAGLPCMNIGVVRPQRGHVQFRVTEAPDVHRARLLTAYALNNPVDAMRPAWR